jgi:MFS transporter, ACS family, D-galactonate transporter
MNQHTGARRWGIAFLLAFGVVIGFFDRINLAVSQQALHVSFGISLIAFGYLASAFSMTYAAMQIPAGMLLDRFGIRRVACVSTFLWSVASFTAAISPGLAVFFAARFLLGIAEAPTFPGNAKALGLWFPPEKRSLPMAITDAAAKFSSAIGVPFLGLLLLHFGWRLTFATTGALSLVYFALFYGYYRNPEARDDETSEFLDAANSSKLTDPFVPQGKLKVGRYTNHHTDNETTTGRGASDFLRLIGLLRQPKVYGLALGWGAYNYSFFLLLNWLPTYLAIAHHMDLRHSVFYTSAPWLFATITDLVVGGWLVDALIQRGWNANRVRRTVLIVGTGCGLAIFGAAHPRSALAALVWISVALGGLAAAAPVAWTVPSLIAPEESVGTLASVANLSGQLAAISAPVITGYIVAATHSFASAFVTAAVILVLGIFGYGVLLGRIEGIARIAEPG